LKKNRTRPARKRKEIGSGVLCETWIESHQKGGGHLKKYGKGIEGATPSPSSIDKTILHELRGRPRANGRIEPEEVQRKKTARERDKRGGC